MSVPGKQVASRRKRIRRSHMALSKAVLQFCQKCRKPVLPHTACSFCGYYKGREVLKKVVPEQKKPKKAKKSKKKDSKDSNDSNTKVKA